MLSEEDRGRFQICVPFLLVGWCKRFMIQPRVLPTAATKGWGVKGDRRTAWQDTSYYFLLFAETKIHPDLQSSVAWKKKSRVKRKFLFLQDGIGWSGTYSPPPKKACREPRFLLAKKFKIKGKKINQLCVFQSRTRLHYKCLGNWCQWARDCCYYCLQQWGLVACERPTT